MDFGDAERRRSADWYADMRLRSKVLHWEANGLMRSPDGVARDLVPMPWRTRVRPSPVRNGYVEGTRAEAAASAMGLVPLATVSRPFGTVAYVESPTPSVAKRERKTYAESERDAIRAKADGTRPVVLSAEDLAKVLRRTAGTIRMGEVD